MPLKLIHGPPNSGRADRIQALFRDALDRDPVLVLPTLDDVFRFERGLCERGAVLGGSVMTFADLFHEVARCAGGAGPGELTPTQRLAAVSAAIDTRRRALGPLRRSAARPGFAVAFGHLLDELQSAGVEPDALGSAAQTLESAAYVGDLGTIFSAYTEIRDDLGRLDAHGVALAAIESLRLAPSAWGGRPVFLYEPGELTLSQRDLLDALSASTEVTVAIPFEQDDAALAARGPLLEQLRERATETEPLDRPAGEEPFGVDPLLAHLQHELGKVQPRLGAASEALVLLRSAGARGEAEAVGVEVAKLIDGGADPATIAIAVRDPVRRGPLLASVLESYGVAVALEAEVPIAATTVGGTLIALLEAELGGGRASDLLRFLRGPSGLRPAQVDWFERAVRRRRVQSAAAALELWRERHERLPGDLAQVRRAAAAGPAELAVTVARLASTMASRPLRSEADGPQPERGDGLELRAAAAISTALGDLAELPSLAPAAPGLMTLLRELRFPAWSGPVEGRVRIASPYRLRASRFEHAFVASLQDGEFPRRDHGGDPFLSEAQRLGLGLEPRRDPDAEERYLFHACLALPSRRLFLSYRDCDENGVAEPRSPFVDDVLRLLEAAPGEDGTEAVEAELTVGRGLAQVVHPPGEAPSANELARAIAAGSGGGEAALSRAGVDADAAGRIERRLERARRAAGASRAPGPLTNPAVVDSLAAVPAYGGTTLEGFDVCSYRWFVSHELDPQPLDPAPDPLVQGGLMHAALERLFRERPGGDPLPRPGSLAAWVARARELVEEIAIERELAAHPAERAIARRVEGLLARFLTDEARRDTGGFEPWLLEASFGEGEDADRPVLEIDSWGLHGAIDRVDRDASGRALVLDYKLSRVVTPREKFEEQAKLQLQLYLIAVAEHWGAETIGGLYHPLRGTSTRRPRGAVRADAGVALASYRLYDKDLVDEEEFERMLDDARDRAGRIVARMRRGDIRRDPGPRPGLRGHDVCPAFCEFAPICRRDRAPLEPEDGEWEER